MRNNILLFVLVLVLSLATASYFGSWYNEISPQYGGWMTSKEDAVTFAGFFVAYIFFTMFLFGLSGFKKNKNWIIVLLIPPALLWIGADIEHIYLPIILGLIAFGLSKLIRMVIAKLRHHNLPMVINK